MPRSQLRAVSSADKSLSVTLASQPLDLTRRELVHLNLCVVKRDPAERVAGRATVGYVGD